MGTIVEKSDSANNYRAEGLGAIGGLLVLWTETQQIFLYNKCVTYCDNIGIVRYAGKPNKPPTEKQSQGGIINLIK